MRFESPLKHAMIRDIESRIFMLLILQCELLGRPRLCSVVCDFLLLLSAFRCFAVGENSSRRRRTRYYCCDILLRIIIACKSNRTGPLMVAYHPRGRVEKSQPTSQQHPLKTDPARLVSIAVSASPCRAPTISSVSAFVPPRVVKNSDNSKL